VARDLPKLLAMTPSHTFEREMPVLVDSSSVEPGLLSKIRYRLAVWRCEFHGHAPSMRFDRDRVYLHCSECDLESPGWDLDGPRPHMSQPGAPDRFQRYSQLAASAALQSRIETGELVVF
jgi:hypothetical protein